MDVINYIYPANQFEIIPQIENLAKGSLYTIDTPSKRRRAYLVTASVATFMMSCLTPALANSDNTSDLLICSCFENTTGEYHKLSLVREIRRFTELSENWDGYGAIPVLNECFVNTETFLSIINKTFITKVSDVFPNPNGTVSFFWKNANKDYVSVEIGCNDMTYFSRSNKKPVGFDNRKITTVEVGEIEKLLKAIL